MFLAAAVAAAVAAAAVAAAAAAEGTAAAVQNQNQDDDPPEINTAAATGIVAHNTYLQLGLALPRRESVGEAFFHSHSIARTGGWCEKIFTEKPAGT